MWHNLPLKLKYLLYFLCTYFTIFFEKVEVRFPDFPEVKAANAVLLQVKGDTEGAQRMFLGIPEGQRKSYLDKDYLKNVISWPPKMIDALSELTKSIDLEQRIQQLERSSQPQSQPQSKN